MPAHYVVAIAKFQPGKQEAFREYMRELSATVNEKEPGTLHYQVLRQQDAENPTIVFFEKYKDKAAFEAHSSTEYYAKAMESLMGIVAEPPTILMMDSIEGFEHR